MSEPVFPSWLVPPAKTGLPDWLTATKRLPDSHLVPRALSSEGKARLFAEYDMIFPRVLEMVCSGSTLPAALREIPIRVDVGAFTRWVMKDPGRAGLLNEAKMIRTEAWTGEMVRHATGEATDDHPVPPDIDRSKLAIETYKWLVSRENRKLYGDTKTIEMSGNVSITAALQQAQTRVIESRVVDVDLIDDGEYLQLPASVDVESGEDDDE